jgi:hypothetical protein
MVTHMLHADRVRLSEVGSCAVTGRSGDVVVGMFGGQP